MRLTEYGQQRWKFEMLVCEGLYMFIHTLVTVYVQLAMGIVRVMSGS